MPLHSRPTLPDPATFVSEKLTASIPDAIVAAETDPGIYPPAVIYSAVPAGTTGNNTRLWLCSVTLIVIHDDPGLAHGLAARVDAEVQSWAHTTDDVFGHVVEVSVTSAMSADTGGSTVDQSKVTNQYTGIYTLLVDHK